MSTDYLFSINTTAQMDTQTGDDDETSIGRACPADPSHSTNGLKTEDSRITLQVGERCFTTYTTTLTTESPYFAALLSDRWRREDGDQTYFIDADGDLFAYILRYLRSGTLPLMYSNSNGHDYGMYHALLGEAEYFGIDRLVSWLRGREYEKMVTVEHAVKDVEELGVMSKVHHSNVKLEYHPHRRINKVYICPRGIGVHRGNPRACGRACQNAQGDAEDHFEEEEILRTVIISRTTVVKFPAVEADS